jgi:4-diphosphocytidyl-2-C-methyl-D-erythritol kinase
MNSERAARLASDRRARAVRIRAFAKINLTLRVMAGRPDGYHEVRTILQAIGLHDRLTFRAVRGPFTIESDEPACPTDRTNLVWRAAARLWTAIGRSGPPRNVRVQMEKRIPMQSGLGGGSSDAAAALRALSLMWRVKMSDVGLRDVAAAIGSDVPFFLEGGTALCLGRGDAVFPLVDWPHSWVVLVVPGFGVSTREAYDWLDRDRSSHRRRRRPAASSGEWPSHSPGTTWTPPADELCNDLEAPVIRRHVSLARALAALRRCGAVQASMTGSGSVVFGLFARRRQASVAATALAGQGYRTDVTKTMSRVEYHARAAASLALWR